MAGCRVNCTVTLLPIMYVLIVEEFNRRPSRRNAGSLVLYMYRDLHLLSVDNKLTVCFRQLSTIICIVHKKIRTGIAQSVWRLATDWMIRRSNPGRGWIFLTRPDRPWRSPSLLYNGSRVIPGSKAAGAWR